MRSLMSDLGKALIMDSFISRVCRGKCIRQGVKAFCYSAVEISPGFNSFFSSECSGSLNTQKCNTCLSENCTWNLVCPKFVKLILEVFSSVKRTSAVTLPITREMTCWDKMDLCSCHVADMMKKPLQKFSLKTLKLQTRFKHLIRSFCLTQLRKSRLCTVSQRGSNYVEKEGVIMIITVIDVGTLCSQLQVGSCQFRLPSWEINWQTNRESVALPY